MLGVLAACINEAPSAFQTLEELCVLGMPRHVWCGWIFGRVFTVFDSSPQSQHFTASQMSVKEIGVGTECCVMWYHDTAHSRKLHMQALQPLKQWCFLLQLGPQSRVRNPAEAVESNPTRIAQQLEDCFLKGRTSQSAEDGLPS